MERLRSTIQLLCDRYQQCFPVVISTSFRYFPLSLRAYDAVDIGSTELVGGCLEASVNISGAIDKVTHVWQHRYWTTLRHVVIGSGLTITLAQGPSFASPTQAAVGTRGTVNIVVSNAKHATGPVCLSLRDLTKNLVVGRVCDGDSLDLNSTRGRIRLDLPRRSFALDVNAPGMTVVHVTPNRFDLKKTQTVRVQLAKQTTSNVRPRANL